MGDLVVSESVQEDHPPKTEAEPINPEEPQEQENKSWAVEKSVPLDNETLDEVDRLLGEGVNIKNISAELQKNGKIVPWTKIRARAAYLARVKSKVRETKPATTQTEEPQDKPEPVAISRKELDLRIWDMWKKEGKTLDEISEILYSEGLYYSPKSVRVRLLSQGACL